MSIQPLLIAGPDSTLADAYELAASIWPGRRLEQLQIPSRDYYNFDLSVFQDYPANQWALALAVNEFYINDVRRALRDQVASLGYSFTSLISPRAHVSVSAQVGSNAVIHAGCFIGTHSKLGDFCCLRPNVVLAENVQVGDFVTLEANVAIREQAILGDFVTVCAGSSLSRSTHVGAHSYLNVPKQYSGAIPAGSFFSPLFPNPVQVLGLRETDG